MSLNLIDRRNKEGVNVQHKGGWTIVVNVYLAWPNLFPPMILPTSSAEIHLHKLGVRIQMKFFLI